MTRKQVRDMVKVLLGEETSVKLPDNFINETINLAQRKVQLDILSVAGKYFIKEHRFEGNITTLPSDMLNINNSIIDILSSTGEVATQNISTSATGYINFTYKIAGTIDWEIIFVTGSALLIGIDTSNYTITITYQNGITTNAQVISALNSNIIFRDYFIETTGVYTSEFVSYVGSVRIQAGSGFMVSAKENDILTSNRMSYNTLLSPDNSTIYYTIMKNYNNVNSVKLYPETVKISLMYYYHNIPSLSSDGDSTAIPPEYKELLILYVALRCLSALKLMVQLDEETVGYQSKIDKMQKEYQDLLAVNMAEPLRLKEKGKL